MPLNNELLNHLGKDELKLILNSPNLVNSLKLSKAIGFILFIVLYWITINVVSHAMLFLKIAIPSTRSRFESHSASGFWTLCIYILELNGVKINIVGDKIENENALIISNHRSIVDHVIFPLLTRRTLTDQQLELLNETESDDELLDQTPDTKKAKKQKEKEKKEKEKKEKEKREKEMKREVKMGSKIKFKILKNEEKIFAQNLSTMLIPKVKFFTWFEIWSIPTIEYFKHIFQADENWELDGKTLVSLFHKYLDSPLSNTQWLTLFPEVNMFTDKDSRMQNILGEKHYLPSFENVLYPRFGAFANVIGGLYKTNYTRLYDITLVYYNRNKVTKEIIDFRAPSLLNILGIRDDNIETVILVHVAGKFLNRVPLKKNKLEKYLENRWIKKDKLIEKLEKRILRENDKLLTNLQTV